MYTVKEKLMKIIQNGGGFKCGDDAGPFADIPCDGCRYEAAEDCVAERIADALIQNGVTILECGMDCKNCWKTKLVNPMQEWVSVDERLPEDGSSVFVMLTHTYESDYVTYGIARYIDTSNGERHWCEDHHGYLEWDKYSDGRGGCSSYKVTRWMPIPVIPELPKGVQ